MLDNIRQQRLAPDGSTQWRLDGLVVNQRQAQLWVNGKPLKGELPAAISKIIVAQQGITLQWANLQQPSRLKVGQSIDLTGKIQSPIQSSSIKKPPQAAPQ